MSQAAEKALMVLEHVASAREPVNATAVTDQLGLDKSTASRLLALLTDLGWLVRDEHSRLFSVGPTMVRLGANAAATTPLRPILLPLLTRLRDATQETVSFHRLIGDRRVCVAGVESEQVIRRALPIGDAFALHVGPTGKAILAFVDGELRGEVLRAAGEETARAVQPYLDHVLETGIVSTDGDHAPEVAGLSVPVFDRDSIFGALTVAGPVHRWTPDRRVQAAASVLAAARSLSASLGADVSRYDLWEQALDGAVEGVSA